MLKQTIENMSSSTRKSLSERTWNDAEDNVFKSLSEELTTTYAIESIKLDPYWPKWNSPWWKALLLSEAGRSELIPKQFIEEMIEALNRHYLHYFPLVETDIPEGCEPYRQIMCHCALGNMCRLMELCGYEVDKQIPWFGDWCERYQLPDGGYNCDEAAYTKSKKSSFLSTLPMLEAMLSIYKRAGYESINKSLEAGAQYLLNHAVYKSSTGKLITEVWLQLSFPRYYDYDVLRGLSFLAEWAVVFGKTLPQDIVADCLKQIEPALDENGLIRITEDKIAVEGSLVQNGSVWVWNEKASRFPALDMFGKVGMVSLPLSRQWLKLLEHLHLVIE